MPNLAGFANFAKKAGVVTPRYTGITPEVLQEKHIENNVVTPVTPVTPEIDVAEIKAEEIIPAALPEIPAEAEVEELPAKSDAELYADALLKVGPCGYGGVGAYLGWGMTRAGQAEAELRLAGRIIYDRTGRGRLRDD